ncbi:MULTISPECIES: hypothetical protein [Bacillus subtilis group]|uniref:hypothetical protein n=1 Tax=Bacillus subtilis group TaxID=653685 RepID=UPI00100A1A81|nr:MULTISPECIES: hypothetical protein [Bacillus subtilis group]MCY8493181.1 hypothetical protein [Bacillus inaquosorum]MDN4184930.1 hypothetical protein [Bacillus subtilis]QAW44579.1 hypothetical protein ETK71_02795 [Bacillus subtilis]UXP20148.1 hypothetical protein N7985_02805 [Bacillus subtilis]UXP27802.1 hypothetical protein N7980_18310 [Bacillus subtilis]
MEFRSRAVIGDHIMFNECISVFRPENINIKENRELTKYLLLDFCLTETLNFDYFSIEPSIEVPLAMSRNAYVTPVKLPSWLEWSDHPHLFNVALAAVFSFVSGRSIKAPREDISAEQDKESLKEVAVHFPVLSAGPGNHKVNISKIELHELYEELKEIINILFNLPYREYIDAMQSIRLVHLAHMNKRDDFGLAYYLLVSSIEPFSTKAIKRKKVTPEPDDREKKWREISEKIGGDFAELFKEYTAEKKKNKLINKRFVEFILKYCPINEWHELKHPDERDEEIRIEKYKELYEEFELNKEPPQFRKREKLWFEKYPEDLTDDEIRKLLSDLYKHRSNFTHRGENPPHKHHKPIEKFFRQESLPLKKIDDQWVVPEPILFPNYILVSFIAKRAITNYLKTKL